MDHKVYGLLQKGMQVLHMNTSHFAVFVFRSGFFVYRLIICVGHTKVYPKVSGLVPWNENCKWYSSLPLGAVVSLFCELV